MKALTLTQRILSIPRESNRAGCWLPKRYVEPHGYARISIDGEIRYLHIVSYEALVGAVPDGKQLDHTCRVRCCFNPQHLEPVTSIENSLRGSHRLFVAHATGICPRGHDMRADGNGYRRKDGRLRCAECLRQRRRQRRKECAS